MSRGEEYHTAGDSDFSLARETQRELETTRAESDLGFQIHTCLQAQSTTVRRFGQRTPGGGEREFNALQRLHAIDPEHLAEPVGLKYGTDGSIIGYNREWVPDVTVADVLEHSQRLIC